MKAPPSAITGIRCVLRGFSLLREPDLRYFVLVPLLLNVGFFGALIYFGASQFSQFLNWLLPDWLDLLAWLLWPIFALAALVIGFYASSLVANLIAAPFNSWLAAAVEKRLSGADPTGGFRWRDAGPEALRALGSELRKTVYVLVRALPLLALFFVPGLQIVAPALWLAFGAWLLAVEYADYPMAHHGLDFPTQRKRLASKRFAAFGFGATVLLVMSIPLLNFVIIPAAVAGATVLWVEVLSEQDRQSPATLKPPIADGDESAPRLP